MPRKHLHTRYLEQICKLVETDFCAEMDLKTFSEIKFTQKEAKEMADIIGAVYMIAHRIHCKACSANHK